MGILPVKLLGEVYSFAVAATAADAHFSIPPCTITLNMWSSIKSDLLEFVSIVTEDTTKTLSKVIGEDVDDNDADVSNIREKMVNDLRRSYNSYALPVEDQYIKEYDKYFKNFQLSSYATEITSILDAEIDVSRYYAELVPTNLMPEEFWSRYFFRIVLLMRGGVVNLDEEYDDEDLAWEGDEASNNETPVASPMVAAKSDMLEANQLLKDENRLLKSQIKMLCSRISELENQLVEKSMTSNALANATAPSAVIVEEGQEDDNRNSVVDSVKAAQEAPVPAIAPISGSSDLSTDGSDDGLVIVDSASTLAPSVGRSAAAKAKALPSPNPNLPSLDEDEDRGWD